MFVRSSFLLAAATGLTRALSLYSLDDTYSPQNFFDNFDFFTDADPTHGFVKYVDRPTAEANGLISQGNVARMSADSSSIASNGRASVRISSKKAYTHGLFIADMTHMPSGCGTWPAFWLLGPNWPNQGEIDIIEGVNSQSSNLMTLHSSDQCSITDRAQTGQRTTSNCFVNAPGQYANQGCQVAANNGQSYGAGFNAVGGGGANGGGVYATRWNSDGVQVWFFPRGNIPADILANAPQPELWGPPMADFGGACDIDAHFREHRIVFNLTFCGDWAGNVWGSDPVCASRANSCTDFVANNPLAFQQAYWEINHLRKFSSPWVSLCGVAFD